MSNPEPDLRRSTRRHRGPLLGIAAGLLFVGLLTAAMLMWWGTEETESNAELEPIERINGDIMGVRPAEGESIDRDLTPGPVGVPEAPGVDVEVQDVVIGDE